jgi:threonine/homoserine/homoserine lactone efflux protein
MDFTALAIFALALFITAGSPGPSVVALVAQVLVRGWRSVLPFLAGMWIGEWVWLTLAIAGLSLIAETFHLAFLAIKYCGVVYLLYLAWAMWTAPAALGQADSGEREGDNPTAMFLTGLTIMLGNPKAMVFYLALLPTLIDLAQVTIIGWAELSATMLAVVMVVDLGYVVLAARARRFLASPRAMRLANRGAAAAMGGAAVAIAAR